MNIEEIIPGGYNGKVLRVNLSNNSITREEIDGPFCRKYLGGAGFVAYYLLKELQRELTRWDLIINWFLPQAR